MQAEMEATEIPQSFFIVRSFFGCLSVWKVRQLLLKFLIPSISKADLNKNQKIFSLLSVLRVFQDWCWHLLNVILSSYWKAMPSQSITQLCCLLL